MKLIGNYTSPYVRKIAIILLEQNKTVEFINLSPWEPDSAVTRYNPLGKVPALVDDSEHCWFDSPVIAGFLLQDDDSGLLPHAAGERLAVRQLEAVADGIMDAALLAVRERQRPIEHQSPQELLRQRQHIERALDWLEQSLAADSIATNPLNIGLIAVGCALDYLNYRRVIVGWCAERPRLVQLVTELLLRDSFARTAPPSA